MISEKELIRYDRQIRIDELGVEGQLKLKNARVIVVGAGGLGCPASIYLAAAGVGYITIIDGEKVELSNLNRQIGHWTSDIGKPKSISLAEKLRRLNPEITIKPVIDKLTPENTHKLIKEAAVVLDCLDNWEARFRLNEACVNAGIPLIHAGVRSFYGQLTTIIPGKSPCLRCILPQNPPDEEVTPVLGVTAGFMGLLEALEAIKIITGVGEPLIGRMLYFDGEAMLFHTIEINRREDCPVCSEMGKKKI